MSLPVPRDPSGDGGLVRFQPRVDEPDLRLRQTVAMFRRSIWWILGCAVLSFAAAGFYAQNAERVYQAGVSLRIDEKQPNLPDVFRTFSQSNDVATDIEVLESRTLVEEATRILELQVRLVHPRGIPRDSVMDSIQVTRDAKRREYRLTRQASGSFEVRDPDGTLLARTRPGERLSLTGVTLRLRPESARFSEMRIVVRPFSDAVAKIAGSISVGRTSEQADIISLRYEDTDFGLVWKIPNVIAARFIEQRQEAQKLATRSQVKFLRQQIDTLSVQLAGAENALKSYRERARVVSPVVEASSQINRMVNLESERSSLEAERSALAQLLEEVEGRHKQQVAGKPSVYRELLAFPSLLRSQAASQLLSSLAQVEDQRAVLLTRRTDVDPDVRLLSNRVKELEDQLSTIALAYLQGLTNQVSSLDAAIARFGNELRSLPRKELEFARLERKPLVLKDMYALLQTRLKEAEIAEAAENSSVSIVDPAIPPRGPFKPKISLIMAVGLVGGLLFGIGAAVAREYADRSIKTRSDATAASGLPVVAIVPHIRRRSHRPAIIARRTAAITRVSEASLRQERQPTAGTPSYTFWSDSDSAVEVSESAKPVDTAANRGMVPRPSHSRMSLSPATGAVAEAYAILQTNITFSRPDQQIKVLVFTSPLPGEGKTTTAVNLALTLSHRGLSVCLVDADMRRPQLHEVFQLPREPGLSEVLRGLQSFDGAHHQVQVGDHQLTVLTAGPQATSAAGLVGSTRMQTLLLALRERFDLVILDTPPVNILTDAALLGVNADGVIVVVRGGSTDAAALQYAMEQLNHVRAPAIGVVLNDIDLKTYGAYDAAYKYYSYGSYTDARPKRG